MRTVNFPELFQKFSADEQKPRTKAELIAYLKSEGDNFAQFLEGLPESFLAETVAMSPQAGGGHKTRFEMLLGAKEHEMHHRAQLMTIERMPFPCTSSTFRQISRLPGGPWTKGQ